MGMCVNLPFCVGEEVRLSEARSSPFECNSLEEQMGIIVYIGVALLNPSSPPTCMIGISIGRRADNRQMYQLSAEHTHFRTDHSVVLVDQSTKQFHICRRSGTVHRYNYTFVQPSLPHTAVSTESKFMRVVHVLRLLLENSVHSMTDMYGSKGRENRRTGRRTCIRFKDKCTLSEWEHLVAHVNRISQGSVLNTPHFDGSNSPRFTQKEMSVEVVDFLTLMRSLGECDPQCFLKYLAVSKRIKRSSNLDGKVITRIIADYVIEESDIQRTPSLHLADGSENECVITLGCTLTAINLSGLLDSEQRCAVLKRPTCEWDPRDRAYTAPMELEIDKAVSLLSRLDENTRERNEEIYSGERRKTTLKRFLGYRWKRLTRIDHRALFFDIDDADKIVGEIQMCIPTLTFFGGSTAVDIANLCTESALSQLFSSSM